MEKACGEAILEDSSMGVFEMQGEPAIVINGVPDAPPLVSPNNVCSRETCWFGVVYEGSDLEYLEWHELEDVLLPLNISIPLKMPALKMINKSQCPVFMHDAVTTTAATAASRDCES